MFIEAITTLLTTKIIPLILALTGFSFLVAFHEFGHFIMCKIFGIHTPTFSIGFGPTIISRKIGGTDFRLASIPLGGYVEIAGLAEVGQGDQEHSKDSSDTSFDTKPYWQKALVMMGGIACNMFFAYVVFTGLYFFGIPKQNVSVVIQSIEQNSAAHASELLKGDVILSINSAPLPADAQIKTISDTLVDALRSNPNKAVLLKIARNGESKKQTIKMVKVLLGSKVSNGKTIGRLGASFGFQMKPTGEYERFGFLESVRKGLDRTHAYVRGIWGFLKSLVQNRTLQGAGGPVAIISTTYSMAQQSYSLLLILLAVISINLAVLNVLPLGALDGGQFLIITVESLFRRKLPEKVKIGIALGFWIFFLTLTAILTYRDILALLW